MRVARYLGASAAALTILAGLPAGANAAGITRTKLTHVRAGHHRHGALSLSTSTTASTTTAPLPTSTTTSTTTTAPPAVSGSVELFFPDAFLVSHQLVTVPHRPTRIGGVVSPYLPGQVIRVRIFLKGRLVKSIASGIERYHGGREGHFSVRFSSPSAGEVVVIASHTATAQMKAFRGSRRFAVLDEDVGFGARGRLVELVQEKLAALHFYVRETGVYDQWTGLAIDAYHRLLRRGTSQTLDRATINSLLDGVGKFQVHFPGHGRHAEGDLSLQLVALVDGSHVQYIFPISSGKPSTPTVLGDYRIYERVPGYQPDGMYYSDYFYRGYAIHGYDPAPDYPASHGCMRLPITDAIFVYDWLAMGDWVDVYN